MVFAMWDVQGSVDLPIGSGRLRSNEGALMTATTASSISWAQTRRYVLPAGFVGTFLEWFDMFVYAQAAALIFPHLFFPKLDPTAGTLASFATFGVGYLARPIGGIIFGHVGDRHGRKMALVMTLTLMGCATVLVGCLPTYSAIGIAAPILLVILRLAQGLGSGAEYAGSLTLVGELAPAQQRGFWTSVCGSGIYLGQMSAAIIAVTLFSTLNTADLYSWGWRIPFLASILLIVVGIVMRMRISESPVFQALEQRQNVRKVPAFTVFHKAPLRLVLSLALTAPIAFNSYMTTTYGLTFSVGRGVPKSDTLIGVILACAAAIFLVPLTGYLSDRYGRKPVFLIQVALTGIIAFPYFAILNSGSVPLLYLGSVLLIAPTLFAMTGSQAPYLPELFASAYRYSGVAMSRELTTAGLTSFTPIVGLALVSLLNGQPWALAGACLFVSLLSFTAVCFLPETRGIIMTPDSADTSEAETVPLGGTDDPAPAVA
jgi:MHS family shikimate/dehydroshikimate transporter-like MFS transporter